MVSIHCICIYVPVTTLCASDLFLYLSVNISERISESQLWSLVTDTMMKSSVSFSQDLILLVTPAYFKSIFTNMTLELHISWEWRHKWTDRNWWKDLYITLWSDTILSLCFLGSHITTWRIFSPGIKINHSFYIVRLLVQTLNVWV